VPRARFTEEDIADWTRRRYAGEPLRTIAAQYGVTTQYVSARTNAAPPPDDIPEAYRRESQLDMDDLITKVNEWLAEQHSVTIQEVKDQFRITSHQWNQIWRRLDNSKFVGKLRDRSRRVTYRDVDIRKALRRALKNNDGKPLSSVRYEFLRDPDTEPSVPTIHNRYGSWRAACADAKVPCGGSRHLVAARTPSPTWSVWNNDQILGWVTKFLETLQPTDRPSYNQYDVWQRTQEGAPSGSLVRVRLREYGSWSDIVAEARSRVAVA
jgi:hypothetical protein